MFQALAVLVISRPKISRRIRGEIMQPRMQKQSQFLVPYALGHAHKKTTAEKTSTAGRQDSTHGNAARCRCVGNRMVGITHNRDIK